MSQSYIALLLVVLFVAANAVLLTGLSHAISWGKQTDVMRQPYESGIPALGSARERFSVKFYLVAMLFILFDIETVFMFPWAVAFNQLREIRGLLLAEMLVFIGILAVGYVYLWKRGAFEWD